MHFSPLQSSLSQYIIPVFHHLVRPKIYYSSFWHPFFLTSHIQTLPAPLLVPSIEGIYPNGTSQSSLSQQADILKTPFQRHFPLPLHIINPVPPLDQGHPNIGWIYNTLFICYLFIIKNIIHSQFNTKNYKFDFMHFSKYLSYQFPNLQIEEGKNDSHLHC